METMKAFPTSPAPKTLQLTCANLTHGGIPKIFDFRDSGDYSDVSGAFKIEQRSTLTATWTNNELGNFAYPVKDALNDGNTFRQIPSDHVSARNAKWTNNLADRVMNLNECAPYSYVPSNLLYSFFSESIKLEQVIKWEHQGNALCSFQIPRTERVIVLHPCGATAGVIRATTLIKDLEYPVKFRSVCDVFDGAVEGTIRQICVSENADVHRIVSARSWYNNAFYKLTWNTSKYGDTQLSLSLLEKIRLSSLSCDSDINPYFSHFDMEVAFICEDGYVRIWNTQSQKLLKAQFCKHDGAQGTSSDLKWPSIMYSSHPRILMALNMQGLCRIDLRSSQSTDLGLKAERKKRFYAVAQDPHHQFNFYISSTNKLLMYDERYLKTPTMNYPHELISPPRNLIFVNFPSFTAITSSNVSTSSSSSTSPGALDEPKSASPTPHSEYLIAFNHQQQIAAFLIENENGSCDVSCTKQYFQSFPKNSGALDTQYHQGLSGVSMFGTHVDETITLLQLSDFGTLTSTLYKLSESTEKGVFFNQDICRRFSRKAFKHLRHHRGETVDYSGLTAYVSDSCITPSCTNELSDGPHSLRKKNKVCNTKEGIHRQCIIPALGGPFKDINFRDLTKVICLYRTHLIKFLAIPRRFSEIYEELAFLPTKAARHGIYLILEDLCHLTKQHHALGADFFFHLYSSNMPRLTKCDNVFNKHFTKFKTICKCLFLHQLEPDVSNGSSGNMMQSKAPCHISACIKYSQKVYCSHEILAYPGWGIDLSNVSFADDGINFDENDSMDLTQDIDALLTLSQKQSAIQKTYRNKEIRLRDKSQTLEFKFKLLKMLGRTWICE